MPKIYQTNNISEAIRSMVNRNDHCIAFKRPWCIKNLPVHLNPIADIPSISCRNWDKVAPERAEKWKKERGLLIYQSCYGPADIMPDADALLYTECPTQYAEFAKYEGRIRREIIVYRPPSWQFHEHTVSENFPSSDYHMGLSIAIKGLIGRELPPMLEAAIDFSGYPKERTTAFYAKEMEAILGVTEKKLKIMLKLYRGFHSRYHCFTPMIPPEDENMRFFYDVLESEPDLYRGTRMLRFFEQHNPLKIKPRVTVPGLKTKIKYMVRHKYIMDHPTIYVVTEGWKERDMSVIDAVANARRGDWFKMRNLVDLAPVYPIDIQSELP